MRFIQKVGGKIIGNLQKKG